MFERSRKQGWIHGALLSALLVVSGSVHAQLTVTPLADDAVTGGDWRDTYGECFYMVPFSEPVLTEVPTGPDAWSTHPEQYADTACPGGPLFDAGKVDWRIFRNDSASPNAFAWSYVDGDVRPGAAQWNPCRGEFFDATWDNDRFVSDPLTLELTLSSGGDARLAYYFYNGDIECRGLDWSLRVDGIEEAFGMIEDFADGVYLVFDLEKLPEPGPTVISLVVVDSPLPAVCDFPSTVPGNNSVISGVFVNGTNECRDLTRTIGYWKTHPDVIDGSFDGAAGFPGLLPLEFCGETIDESCDAVAWLSSGDGGIDNFERQGVGALLNCAAFGCPAEIYQLVSEGSLACAGGAGFDFGGAGSTLDVYNNSGDDLALPFQSPPAQPHFCRGPGSHKRELVKRGAGKTAGGDRDSRPVRVED